MPDIQIRNMSARISDELIASIIPGLQAQINEEVYDTWGVSGQLRFIHNADFQGSDFHCLIQDTQDDPRDAGFHTVVVANNQQVPEARLFADAFDFVNGELNPIKDQLSVAMSHELIEMLVNPATTRPAQGDPSYAVEACDPVSGTSYQKGNVRVSNFVTPRYYGFSPTRSVDFDRLQKLQGPMPNVIPGGYLWKLQQMAGGGPAIWMVQAAPYEDGSLDKRLARSGRNTWRARHAHNAGHIAPP